MEYRVAVCDDERPERERVSRFLGQCAVEHGIRISVDAYSSGEDFLKGFLEGEQRYDMVFLDIEMGGADGLAVAAEIRRKPDCRVMIAYVTAHAKYMQQSFDVQPAQYFVKPLEYNVFREKFTGMRKRMESDEIQMMVLEQKGEKIFFDLREVQCIESVKRIRGRNKLEVTLPAKTVSITGNLAELEKKLQGRGFVRVHREVLVNLRFIYKFQQSEVILKSGKVLPLSRKYAKEIKSRLPDFLILKYRM